jgi:AbrB family looped-hinge helix DNA binding protein
MSSRYEIKPARQSRVGETASAYEKDEASAPAPTAYGVTMAARGRVVLPVEVRDSLQIKEGDRLTLVVEPDGSIRLLTTKAFIARLRGVFRHVAPGRSLVDELIADRRREAAAEERDWRHDVGRRRKSRR